MPNRTVADLGRMMKAKFPGAYDHVGDAELGRAVQRKYPDAAAYQTFVDAPDMEAAHGPALASSHEEDEPYHPADLTPGEKAGNWIGRGAWALPGLVGLDYETVSAAERALRDPDKSKGFGERYRTYKGAEEATSEQADAENPILSGLVRGAAGAPGEALAWLAAAPAKAATTVGKVAAEAAGRAPTFFRKALEWGPKLGTTAAASEYGSTGAKPMGERLQGAAATGLAATVLGGMGAGVLPNPAALAPSLGGVREKGPRVATTPEAFRLEQAGVDNLTSGQRAGQNSILGRLEGASADAPAGMRAEREAAKDRYRQVRIDRSRAPGAEPSTAADLHQRFDETLRGFDPDYAKVKGVDVPADAMSRLTDVEQMPKRGIDARTKGKVASEVKNALTVLGEQEEPQASGLLDARGRPIEAPPPPPLEATTGDLMKVRENMREELRAAVRSGDFDRQKLLNQAISQVTSVIESALSPEERALLRQTDQQYRRLMQVEQAAPAGRTDFTPQQDLRSIEKSAGRRKFKRGKAGPDQQFSEDARKVFEDPPRTGWFQQIVNLPLIKHAPGVAARMTNTKAGRSFFFDPRISHMPRGAHPGVTPVAATLDPTVAGLVEWLRGGHDAQSHQ